MQLLVCGEWALIFVLCLRFQDNLLIAGEGKVVCVFVVIAVNTIMMALLGVMVSAIAGTEVSALLTCVWGLRYWV